MFDAVISYIVIMVTFTAILAVTTFLKTVELEKQIKELKK